MSQTLDLGFCCELALIQIFKQTPSLAALLPVHADEDTDSQNVRIVVKAEGITTKPPGCPNPRNPALNVSVVSMRCQVRASLGQMTVEALHTAYGSVCQVVDTLDGPTFASIPDFSLFNILIKNVDLEQSRENDEQRRKLYKTFSFLAQLKNVQALP